MNNILRAASIASILFAGAIFGFFYAWVCSTMWGLDQLEPATAIQAMQAMNASVRNGVFAPAFFGTPVVIGITAALAYFANQSRAALYFVSAALMYFCFGMLLTMLVNVPMNEALAMVDLTSQSTEPGAIWIEYSQKWQFWNQTRTVASGITLILCGLGILSLQTETCTLRG